MSSRIKSQPFETVELHLTGSGHSELVNPPRLAVDCQNLVEFCEGGDKDDE